MSLGRSCALVFRLREPFRSSMTCLSLKWAASDRWHSNLRGCSSTSAVPRITPGSNRYFPKALCSESKGNYGIPHISVPARKGPDCARSKFLCRVIPDHVVHVDAAIDPDAHPLRCRVVSLGVLCHQHGHVRPDGGCTLGLSAQRPIRRKDIVP